MTITAKTPLLTPKEEREQKRIREWKPGRRYRMMKAGLQFSEWKKQNDALKMEKSKRLSDASR